MHLGPTDVYAEVILASGVVGIRVLVEICQRILHGKRMPDDWTSSIAIPILMEMEMS